VPVDPELPLKNSLLGMRPETCHQQLVNDHEYRIVVGSWNVAGMLPPDDIDLQEWLDTTQPADIYVIGWVVFNIFGHSVLLACFSGEVSCLLLLTLSFVLTSLVPFAKTGVENLL
jgi:hypothetical protein